jgi:murein L,D-transpeptidase YafK
MKRTCVALLLGLFCCSMTPTADFYQSQLRFPRVRDALRTKGKLVDDLLQAQGINPTQFDVFFRAFKKEQKLEVWAKNKAERTYKLLKTYDFCAFNGGLGPKRRTGDKQIPEGFYSIDAFNPTSEYYLSFRVNYPNESDRKFNDPINPGGDIYIHGSCLTIGCIPIGDDNIKEAYLLAARAKSGGQTIPIHIFPTYLTAENYAALQRDYAGNTQLLEFWSWLKPGYDAFDNQQVVPTVRVDEAGRYVVE